MNFNIDVVKISIMNMIRVGFLWLIYDEYIYLFNNELNYDFFFLIIKNGLNIKLFI